MSLGATLVIRSYIIIILCCGLEVWMSMRTRAAGPSDQRQKVIKSDQLVKMSKSEKDNL